MKIRIEDINNNKIIEKETDGLTWINSDNFETETCIFFPQEIAIEVGYNYASTNGGEIFDIDDIRHDIICYFTDYIENILEETIEFIKDYGDDVQ